MKNPFPGPQPYRAADRDRFFGRIDTANKLEGSILANRCVTVYGPSGAGKSSVLQASVFPTLVERYDVRLVRVDAWPASEDPTAWLASTMQAELTREPPLNAMAHESVLNAAKVAARSSSRLLVVYLDQLEQLLFSGRTIEETQPFFDCVEALLDLPLRNVRVVLSLREDYLGRFRDRLRDLRRITENGFRVGPLTVQELTEAVVLAAAVGEPAQSWTSEEMRGLMLQVRVPGQAATDDAEAQSAYAQIICRALFQERAAGKTVDVTEAEPILQNYLASTVLELGQLFEKAQLLLEDHLVGADGSRTLRTEKELSRIVEPTELAIILKQLENAAILRAEEHHGSRYFELGHDWLARRVHEQREERERLAEQKRIEEIQARQLVEARAQQRKLQGIAAAATAIATLVAAAAIVAWIARTQAVKARKEAEAARQAAEVAEQKAEWERDEANDLRLMAGYLALQSRGDSTSAMKLLSAVKKPEERSGWVAFANAALEKNALVVTLHGHREALRLATYSADGKRVLTASHDKTARIWNADGTGSPVILAGHKGAITSASFSPEKDSTNTRVLTTSADGTAHIWSIHGTEAKSIVLAGAVANEPGKKAEVTFGAWSNDGQRVVIASIVTQEPIPPRLGAKPTTTNFVRVHSSKDGSILGEHAEHLDRVNGLVFLDDTHIISVSDDKTARVWNGVTKSPTTPLAGHAAPITFVTVNRANGVVVTASADAKARVFKQKPTGTLAPLATLEGHSRALSHAAISADGKFVATGSADRTARVWNIEQPFKKGSEVVLDQHEAAVTFVAFRPGDARTVATAANDHQGRIFTVDAPEKPLVLSGHTGPLSSIEWNPEGDRLVTAAADASQSAAADHSARIWSAKSIGQRLDDSAGAKRTFHVAAFGADQTILVTAYDDSTVESRPINSKAPPMVFNPAAGERWGFVSAAVPSPDGQQVAIASLGADVSSTPQDTSVRWVRGLHLRHWAAPDKPIQTRELPAAPRFVSWNQSGDRIVVALEDSTAMMFHVGTNHPPVIFKGHTKWLTSASFSLDGKALVTTSIDKTVLVFNVDMPASAPTRFEHPSPVYSAAFDPTGQRLATAGADGVVRIFDLRGGTPTVLDAKGVPLYRVTWNADGKRLAVASAASIMVWSRISWPILTDTHPSVLPMEAPTAALAFTKDGNKLMAAAVNKVFTWSLDVKTLQSALQEANQDCLRVSDRVVYMNEAPRDAQRTFEECETARGRGFSSEPIKTSDESNFVVARLLVQPVTAEVEWDGVRATPRDGLFELWGKEGQKKTVRFVMEAFSTEIEVELLATGGKPSVIDVGALYRASGIGAAKKPLAAGEGDFDSLINVEFH